MNIQSAVIAAVVGSTLVSSTLSAQGIETRPTSGSKSRWELIVPSGKIVPTGAQRDAVKHGDITAVQLSFLPRPTLALTTMFAWARSRDLATAGDPKLDVFTYDIGAEARAPKWKSEKGTTTFTPFAGLGAGGRSYNHRKLEIDATHNVAAYGSVGGELGVRRVRVRIEARDYVAGFKPLLGAGASRTSNDVVVMAAVRVVAR